MILTPQQKQTLKTWILANLPTSGDQEIADALNATSSPSWYVWRTNVLKSEYTNSVGPEGSTFAWSGAGGFIARSAGEQSAWRELFNGTLSVNPSQSNVRQAFADIFSGSGVSAVANRSHMTAVSRRVATVGEKIFATGTGTTGSPGTMAIGCEGDVTVQNVVDALSL